MTRTTPDSGTPREGHPDRRGGLFHSRGAARRFAAIEQALFAALASLLALLSLPIPGVAAWAWLVMEIVAFALFAGWLLLWALGGRAVAPPLRMAAAAAGVAAASAVLLAARLAGDAPEVLPRSLACVALFLVSVALAGARRRARILAYAIFYPAAAHAVLAALGLAEAQSSGFRALLPASAAGMGLVLAAVSDRSADRARASRAQRAMLHGAVALTLLAAFSGPPVEAAAVFGSLLVATGLGLALARHATRGTVRLLSAVLVADLLAIAAWLGLGMPAGEALLPRSGPLPGHAAALAAAGIAVLASVAAAVAAQWHRRDPLARGVAFASVMGTVGLLALLPGDFHLRTPSNAAAFAALLAFAWIALRPDRPAGVLPNVRAPE